MQGGSQDSTTFAGSSIALSAHPLPLSVIERLAPIGDPDSHEAHEFRTIALMLRELSRTEGRRRFIFSSYQSGQGTTAAALNTTLALVEDMGLRVGLVEVNFRTPQLASSLGIPDQPGLLQLLRFPSIGLTPALSESCLGIPGRQLVVLRSGGVAPNPSEIYCLPSFRDLMRRLERECDLLLLDGPPYFPLADLALLKPYFDGVLVVVQAECTKKVELDDFIARFKEPGVVGVIFNQNKT